MLSSNSASLDVYGHNQSAWDRLAISDCEWSRPVAPEITAAAKRGKWSVRLTPGELPSHWLGDVKGCRILCLASAGGQQAPVLAAAGGEVTVFDASEKQLELDRKIAARDGLELKAIQGDMRDLSCFADETFDIVFNPISNLYVPGIRPVWRECHRVLKPQGRLLASFYNPVVFMGDRDPALMKEGLIRPVFMIPYADARDLDATALEAKLARGETLVSGHSLSDQIAGQIEAGFHIAGFLEDRQPAPRFLVDKFLPTFIATLALKVA
ncbi:class I SAM-dependent methyltransferase [Rhizobium sp. BR 314]|uniref:class I SAM-dependent methyltransferase n=1 Tax=Rhizobium sp. BR 314 TaxID=3040013 RepID=UPI0039BF894B